jgi:hypothetical protein
MVQILLLSMYSTIFQDESISVEKRAVYGDAMIAVLVLILACVVIKVVLDSWTERVQKLQLTSAIGSDRSTVSRANSESVPVVNRLRVKSVSELELKTTGAHSSIPSVITVKVAPIPEMDESASQPANLQW